MTFRPRPTFSTVPSAPELIVNREVDGVTVTLKHLLDEAHQGVSRTLSITEVKGLHAALGEVIINEAWGGE